MPYGAKRGIRSPGEYGVGDLFGLGLASSAGIIAALITDYQQKGEASSLYTINQWAAALGNISGLGDIPLWWVILGLIAIGAGSIFYFQPITRQGAFAQGFGLLAVVMTSVPSDLAVGIEAMELSTITNPQPAALYREASFSDVPMQPDPSGGAAVVATETAQIIKIQDGMGATRYNVELTLRFPGGLQRDIETMIRRGTLRGRLHNADSGESWNLFRTAGGDLSRNGNDIIIDAGVPARHKNATIWVRIECAGYVIETQSKEATLGIVTDWPIEMKPSRTPLFIQRLRQSYWF